MRTPHHRIDVIPLFLVRSADGFCSIPKILSVFRLIGCQTGRKSTTACIHWEGRRLKLGLAPS
jgi:hypothetical protein